MAYLPDFSRDAKGKFNYNLNFLTLKGGTDAYLIEDEWNELQWIQTEERARLIRTMTHSGCLQISDKVNTEEPGAYKAHLYLIRDEEGAVQQHSDIINSNGELNCFTINPFNAVLNGYLARIESTSNNGALKVYLEEPYPASKDRQDLVILEFWFKEVRPHDQVPLFGGIENEPVSFEMIDHRISVPTTNRVQLQWRIRAIADDKQEVLPHYDNGRNRIEYLHIHPQGPKPYETVDFIYKTADFKPFNDPQMFVAGIGEESKLVCNTIDGYIYAIPLFEVSRLNISGYNAYNNVNGGLLWKNSESISDRASLDNKFANVVYTNEINDQRYQAYVGKAELDKRYTSSDSFKDYSKETDNRITLNTNNIETLINENNSLRKEVEFLTLLTL